MKAYGGDSHTLPLRADERCAPGGKVCLHGKDHDWQPLWGRRVDLPCFGDYLQNGTFQWKRRIWIRDSSCRLPELMMRYKPGKPWINRLELSGSRLFLILSEFYFASTLYRASYSFVKSPHFAHLCSVAIDIFLEYHYNQPDCCTQTEKGVKCHFWLLHCNYFVCSCFPSAGVYVFDAKMELGIPAGASQWECARHWYCCAGRKPPFGWVGVEKKNIRGIGNEVDAEVADNSRNDFPSLCCDGGSFLWILELFLPAVASFRSALEKWPRV